MKKLTKSTVISDKRPRIRDENQENDRVETTTLGSSQLITKRTIQKKIGYNATSYEQYLKSQPNLTAVIGPSENCTVLNEEALTVYIEKSNMDDKNQEDEVDDQNTGLNEHDALSENIKMNGK
ncbi:hypothetical protein Fot_10240 [Forsythia ovata]|uniref:Uncharacterized protein n=1 Tax=Forsythia ovata TaxID=205694 RepID=A0ABD1WGY8_9LAMI